MSSLDNWLEKNLYYSFQLETKLYEYPNQIPQIDDEGKISKLQTQSNIPQHELDKIRKLEHLIYKYNSPLFSPLKELGLDRDTLISYGIDRTMQDRLYRSLFVHCNGIFEFINELEKSYGKDNLTKTGKAIETKPKESNLNSRRFSPPRPQPTTNEGKNNESLPRETCDSPIIPESSLSAEQYSNKNLPQRIWEAFFRLFQTYKYSFQTHFLKQLKDTYNTELLETITKQQIDVNRHSKIANDLITTNQHQQITLKSQDYINSINQLTQEATIGSLQQRLNIREEDNFFLLTQNMCYQEQYTNRCNHEEQMNKFLLKLLARYEATKENLESIQEENKSLKQRLNEEYEKQSQLQHTIESLRQDIQNKYYKQLEISSAKQLLAQELDNLTKAQEDMKKSYEILTKEHQNLKLDCQQILTSFEASLGQLQQTNSMLFSIQNGLHSMQESLTTKIFTKESRSSLTQSLYDDLNFSFQQYNGLLRSKPLTGLLQLPESQKKEVFDQLDVFEQYSLRFQMYLKSHCGLLIFSPLNDPSSPLSPNKLSSLFNIFQVVEDHLSLQQLCHEITATKDQLLSENIRKQEEITKLSQQLSCNQSTTEDLNKQIEQYIASEQTSNAKITNLEHENLQLHFISQEYQHILQKQQDLEQKNLHLQQEVSNWHQKFEEKENNILTLEEKLLSHYQLLHDHNKLKDTLAEKDKYIKFLMEEQMKLQKQLHNSGGSHNSGKRNSVEPNNLFSTARSTSSSKSSTPVHGRHTIAISKRSLATPNLRMSSRDSDSDEEISSPNEESHQKSQSPTRHTLIVNTSHHELHGSKSEKYATKHQFHNKSSKDQAIFVIDESQNNAQNQFDQSPQLKTQSIEETHEQSESQIITTPSKDDNKQIDNTSSLVISTKSQSIDFNQDFVNNRRPSSVIEISFPKCKDFSDLQTRFVDLLTKYFPKLIEIFHISKDHYSHLTSSSSNNSISTSSFSQSLAKASFSSSSKVSNKGSPLKTILNAINQAILNPRQLYDEETKEFIQTLKEFKLEIYYFQFPFEEDKLARKNSPLKKLLQPFESYVDRSDEVKEDDAEEDDDDDYTEEEKEFLKNQRSILLGNIDSIMKLHVELSSFFQYLPIISELRTQNNNYIKEIDQLKLFSSKERRRMAKEYDEKLQDYQQSSKN